MGFLSVQEINATEGWLLLDHAWEICISLNSFSGYTGDSAKGNWQVLTHACAFVHTLGIRFLLFHALLLPDRVPGVRAVAKWLA